MARVAALDADLAQLVGGAAGRSNRCVHALAALGGRGNVVEVGAASSRLWLRLSDPSELDENVLKALGTRAIARPGADIVHLIVGADAEPIAASLLQ